MTQSHTFRCRSPGGLHSPETQSLEEAAWLCGGRATVLGLPGERVESSVMSERPETLSGGLPTWAQPCRAAQFPDLMLHNRRPPTSRAGLPCGVGLLLFFPWSLLRPPFSGPFLSSFSPHFPSPKQTHFSGEFLLSPNSQN